MRSGVLIMAAALAFGAAAQLSFTGLSFAQTAPAEREPEEPTVFPDGENRDEVFYVCTACHGSDIVRAQGHSRERWSQVLDIMVERHGMVDPDKQDREMMLDYLAKAFPPRGRVYINPFLRQ